MVKLMMRKLYIKRSHPAPFRVFALLLFTLVFSFSFTVISSADKLTKAVKELNTAGDRVNKSQLTKVRKLVLASRENALEKAVKELKDKNTDETKRAIWIWVLGLTGNEEAVKHVIAQEKAYSSPLINANVDNSLGEIGGHEAGRYLYRKFTKTKNDLYKSHLLVLMARAGFEDSLRRSESLLKLDPEDSQFMAAKYFVVMGDKSIPFLLAKLKHYNSDVRKGAVMMLGQWLMPKEALKPLREMLATEKDPNVRLKILDSIERNMINLNELENFMKKIKETEKDSRVRRFADESLRNLPKMKKAILERSRERKPDKKAFTKVWKKMFETRGRDNSYKELGLTSDITDEGALADLRGQILRRGTPESIFAGQRINRIILINRLIKSQGLK
jgi:HEAT repeat protein